MKTAEHNLRSRCPSPIGGSAKSQEGIALIIVMISIFVLTMLAGGFAYSMKIETRLARNADSEAQLEWLGRSAVEKARWILAEQFKIAQEPYDGLDQVWAGGPGGIATSNSPLANISLSLDSPEGHATFSIVDLERKVNINLANEAILQQALTVAGVDAGDSTRLVNSILDWMDPDDRPRVQGAESDFYQDYWPDHPYSAKNGPIDDISELLLIQDITPELFWGAGSTNFQMYAFSPQTRRGAPPVPTVGLTNLFTALSSGRININTASAEVLQVIPGVTPEMAQGIVGARSGEPDPMGLSGPYRSVDQVRRVPEVNIMVARAIQQFCDVRSRTFEVHVDAQVGGYHRHFVGVLGRAGRDVPVLGFYWTD
ncbi:MAG TPA: general secretion pathway protein GspK [Verrucomicrobiae bacterium]